MKILIDIDENVYTRLFDNGIEDYEIVNDDLFKIAKSIRTGIPFDKIRAEIIKKQTYKLFEDTEKLVALDEVLQIIDKYRGNKE